MRFVVGAGLPLDLLPLLLRDHFTLLALTG